MRLYLGQGQASPRPRALHLGARYIRLHGVRGVASQRRRQFRRSQGETAHPAPYSPPCCSLPHLISLIAGSKVIFSRLDLAKHSSKVIIEVPHFFCLFYHFFGSPVRFCSSRYLVPHTVILVHLLSGAERPGLRDHYLFWFRRQGRAAQDAYDARRQSARHGRHY